MLDYLHEIKAKEDAADLTNGSVTVEEIVTAEEWKRQQQRNQKKDPESDQDQ
jgi:hypothetical protein